MSGAFVYFDRKLLQAAIKHGKSTHRTSVPEKKNMSYSICP